MRFNKLILVLLIAMTIVSCRKDDVSDPTIIDTTTTPWETMHTYTVDVQGIVKNANGDIIPNAIVNVEGQQVESSDDGVFYLEKVLAPQTGLYINADAQGYFEGGSSIYAHKNQVYSVEITLVPFQGFVQFDAGTDLNYVAEDGSKVSIPANGIVDAQGAAYTGTVDFYTYWLDPTDDNLTNLSPGSLIGIQEDELVALRSYGMMAVELYGENGEELNLAEGTNADLSFPVPDAILSSASDEIDLWHFNETTGKWDLEGKATLVNGVYEAQVSHFSWWNCDVPFNSEYFCFDIVDPFGNPVANVTLTVYVEGFGFASANIGHDATYCDLVPVGQDMTVLLTTQCGDVLLDDVIQAVSGQEGVDIVVPIGSGDIDVVNIYGEVGCGSNGPISNGYVVLSVGSQFYMDYVDENGNYSIDVINCQGEEYEATITAYDLDELLGGTDEVIIGSEDVMHPIDACEDDASQELMILNSDNGSFTLFECVANISVAEITIIAKLPGNDTDYAILGVVGFDEGTYNGNLLSSLSAQSTDNGSLNAVTIEIEQYSDVPGEKIIGSFSLGSEFDGNFVATVK